MVLVFLGLVGVDGLAAGLLGAAQLAPKTVSDLSANFHSTGLWVKK